MKIYCCQINNDLTNVSNRIKSYTSTPSNLADFIQSTAFPNTWVYCHFKDTNDVLGLGATWLKGYIQFQNTYGSQYDVGGEGIFTKGDGTPYFVKISGTTTFTSTVTQIIKGTESITNTSGLVCTRNYKTVVVSFNGAGVKHGDNLSNAIGSNKPLRTTSAVILDSISKTTKLLVYNTNGTVSVYNQDFTAYTGAMSVFGEMTFHVS